MYYEGKEGRGAVRSLLLLPGLVPQSPTGCSKDLSRAGSAQMSERMKSLWIDA